MERQRQIIVIDVSQLPPGDQRTRFLATLRGELETSGLGEMLEQAPGSPDGSAADYFGVHEVAVALAHADYGRELADRLVFEAGLRPRCSVMPTRWRPFNCEDYFASDLAERGYYDPDGQYEYIYPRERTYEDDHRDILVIGSPGCDGIAWGYRRSMTGIWAWYPIGAEFRYMAPGVESLLDGWLAGTIHV